MNTCCVYGIVENRNANEIKYVGSTKNLNRRIIQHRSCAKLGNSLPLYQYIGSHGGFNNFGFVILKYLDFTTSRALTEVEESYIRKFDPPLNKNSAHIGMSLREYHSMCTLRWYYKNRERALVSAREHYRNNRERIKKMRKERYHRQVNCDVCNRMVKCFTRHKKTKKHQMRLLHKRHAKVMAELKEESNIE